MTDDPLQVALRSIYDEIERIKLQAPSTRWFFFGSVATRMSSVSDIDLLVICQTDIDCLSVRSELAAICERFPIHLLLMSHDEEAEMKFIQGVNAIEIAQTPG